MPLKLARDLLNDRYTTVLNYTLLLLMVALPPMLLLSALRDNNAPQAIGVAILTAAVYGMYFMLRKGRTSWVSATLVAALIVYSTWDMVAYGSVRSAGVAGYVCAVAATGIMMRRRYLILVFLMTTTMLGVLSWMEARGLMTRSGFSIGLSYWLSYVTVLGGIALGTATTRYMFQQALRAQRVEILRREEAERASRRSHEQFSRIFQLSPSGIMVQSLTTRRVLDINPAFERMFGFTRDEYLGVTHLESLWVDIAHRDEMFIELLQARRLLNKEVLFRKRDGSVFNAMMSCEIGGEPGNEIIVNTIADVTVEVHSRNLIRRSEELFSKAFNFTPINMCITRLSDGEFLAINEAEDSVQGYRREELIGRSSMETGSWQSPAERERFLHRLASEGEVLKFETRMRHKLGHMVDCLMWAVIVDVDGEACVLSCTLNISEEKRREAILLDVARGMSGETGAPFFRVLVEHMARAMKADTVLAGEVVGGADIRSLSIMTDGVLREQVQYPLAGTPCEMAVNWQDICTYNDKVAELFPHDKPLVEQGMRAYMGLALRDADGSAIGVLSVLWRTPQNPSPDREALMRIFASRATSELVRMRREREIMQLNETLEQRVAARTAELQATNAELESFAYSVSHDLQTPLRGIDGFTALIGQQLDSTLNDEQRRMFGRVRINVSRMGELIADLLALAKVSKREMHKERVDLSALAEAVLESACDDAPERKFEIRVQADLHAHCDRSLARIALENLAGNAIKYTRGCDVARIQLGAMPRAPNEPLVMFIRDNGVGFDMTYADKLFKPFTRLHHEHEFEGSGIGLATVHRIMERHGGGVSGSAALDQGATFYFSFDAHPDHHPGR